MSDNLINSLLEKFDSNSIQYVHWKSNTNILKALNGMDDLDILINPKQKSKVYEIFNELKIIRGYSIKDDWQKGIFHFYGLDIANKYLIHIHLHLLLEMGYDYDKRVNLPVINAILDKREKFHNIYLPKVEKEYIILIIRLLLKNSLSSFLLMTPPSQIKHILSSRTEGIIKGGSYKEYIDLKNKINKVKLELTLRNNFSFISKESFFNYEKVIENNNSIFSLFWRSSQLQKELDPYCYHGRIRSFMISAYRLNKERFRFLFQRKAASKKLVENGGRIFAFIGGDGAGKTTNVSALYKILSEHFYTVSIHLGRPQFCVEGIIFLVMGKTFKLLGGRNLGLCFYHIATAYNRNRAFKKAIKVKEKGGLVIVDRLPIHGITSMDCPRIEFLKSNRFSLLAKWEKYLYSKITGVDDLIVLKLDPKIAISRRPNDNPEELMIRSGQIWQKDFSDYPGASVIYTHNSMDYVQLKILKIVSESLNKKNID